MLPGTTINNLTEDIESGQYIDEYVKRKIKFKPHVNYSTASNFAKFGLAEEYYESAVKRIYEQYPYDGSSFEKIKWVNDSPGLDLYLLENEYPRTHGYIKFSPSGWGSRVSTSGSYGNPATKEYVYIKGGPNIDNVWSTASNRTSNLTINGGRGNTVEFWLKKDAYQSLTKREVLFDAWTSGSTPGDHKYGRLTIELDSSLSTENSPWVVTYRSGSTGFKNLIVSGAAGLYASASDGEWHHYAFAFQNTGSQVNYRMYVDGDLNHQLLTGSSVGGLNTTLVANIGSLVAAKDASGTDLNDSDSSLNPGLGFGKLSGSLDEFRFWKTKRSSKDIGRNWFAQVDGGSNVEDPNVDLGIYYKFNEGITLTSSIDKVVLDYSGRVSNGNWVGYASGARSIKSAIIQSSASATEFAEPIIHVENPKLNKYLDDVRELGKTYDVSNNAAIYHSVPGWILEEDDNGELRKLTQIMGSYFDELFLQIQHLASLKHLRNQDYGNKPLPFMDTMLRSAGFETPEIFIEADVLSAFASRDEKRNYEQRLEDVKNVIYQNIYNNLVHIYKSKGTEKAFRNLLRCYGIDEEIVKINMYADGVDYPVEQNYRVSSLKTRCINFYHPHNHSATIYQYSSSLGRGNKSSEFPVSGYITGAHGNDSSVGLSFTTEAEVVFPKVHRPGEPGFISTNVSSSLFGAHTVKGAGTDLAWPASAKDFANFETYAVKDERHSRNAKFVIRSTSGIVSAMESPVFYDVYDGTKWNFAVRVAPKGTFGNTISGSTNSYQIEYYGIRTDAGEVKDKFYLTSSLTNAQGQRFHQYSKRLYAGAHRTDFAGSTKTLSDVHVSSLRHWLSYLDNETIKAHSIDPKAYGVPHPMRNAYTFMPGLDNPVPSIDTLALNWDFTTVTGSSTGGQFIIDDITSGSFKNKRDYGWAGDVVATNHPGRGDFFQSNSTSSVTVAFLEMSRQNIPENVQSSNMVRVLSRDEQTFTRDSKPINYNFSIEKSMYQAISQEMLDMFATIKDFSNLIGEPVNRYRPNYKSMEKLRQLFFDRIENTPDIEKYVEFYKWIDSALSSMLDQLKPASADFSEDIRNMIESHVLERNKYWAKFPTLEGKQAEPEPGQIKSINELVYNWKFGHAPLLKHTGIYKPSGSALQTEICLWWSERAGRKETSLSSGISATDAERETLRRTIYTEVSGTSYTLRSLTKPYRLKAEIQPVVHAGDNFHLNKKKDFFLGTSNPGAKDFIRISGSDVDFGKECTDVYHPRYGNGIGSEVFEKKRLGGKADISNTNADFDLNTIAPFSMYSSSTDVPTDYKAEIYDNFKKGIDITNLHSDAYGDDREIPIQSPFTEHWVGGHSHRHQHLNMMRPKIPQADPALQNTTMSLDHKGRRFEAFALTMSQGQLYVTSPNLYALNHEPPGTFHVSLTSSTHNRSRVLREPLAKRPVNIRNIKTTASEYAKDTVLNIGNYKHEYEIVQGTSVEMSPVFLIRTASNEPIGTTTNSPYFVEINERRKYERPKRKNVFVNRFSAPGGVETAGDSLGGPGLDVATNQYSVYNTLNYRNLMARLALNEWSTDRMGQFGATHNSSITSSTTTASYHKVQGNPRYVATSSDESGHECRPKYDNNFVQHQIPQSDLGYAWIRNSTLETTCSYNRLESNFTYPKSQTNEKIFETNEANAVDFESPTFLSASDRGLRTSDANRLLSYGVDHALTNRPDPGIPTDFLGLNSIIYEHVSQSNNTLGGLAPIDSRGGLLTSSIEARLRAHTLNHMLLNRGSIHGYPTWKQLRAGDHPVARKLRKENIFSLAVRRDDPEMMSFSPSYFTDGDYSWPENIEHTKTRTSRTISSQRYRFTESVVTYSKPLTTTAIASIDESSNVPVALTTMRAALLRTPGGRSIASGGKITYLNDLVTFSNPELVRFLQIDQIFDMSEALSTKMPKNIVQSVYPVTIYPRDVNSYSNKSRKRENFVIDWWKTKRSDRGVSEPNSQGEHIGITSSMWPLDAQENFGTSKEISLGTDVPGTFGEGELMSSYSLFRSGSNTWWGNPSASALYARKFPETPWTYCLTVEEANRENYWNKSTYGDSWNTYSTGGVENSYMEIVFNGPGTEHEFSLVFVKTEALKVTRETQIWDTGRPTIAVCLSQSSYTKAGIADAIKETINTHSGIKPRIKASSSGAKVTLEFRGVHEKSRWPTSGYRGGFSGTDYTLNTSMDGARVETVRTGIRHVSLLANFLKVSASTNTYLAGAAKWEAGDQAGRYPFNYENYDDYAQDMRIIGKEYSVIPEYRISDHMSDYMDSPSQDPFFDCFQSDFLSLTGASDNYNNSSQGDFFKVYGHSDFIKHFEIVKSGHRSLEMHPANLTLKCKALKKLLPYKGFYPAQRTLQLAETFKSTYGPGTSITPEDYTTTGSNYAHWRTALAPFYSPGITYNSIKSGIAVDYPVFVPKKDRPYLEFVTLFNGSGSTNRCDIGQAQDWMKMVTGSIRKASTAATSGISFSMWANFKEDPDDATNNPENSGSLIHIGDDNNCTEGIQFLKRGGRLVFGMWHGSSSYKEWQTKKRILSSSNLWHHMAVTKKFDGSAPAFYLNGKSYQHELTRSAGTLNETALVFEPPVTGDHNCSIGNTRAATGSNPEDIMRGSMEMAVAEVTIWNKQMSTASILGLHGGESYGSYATDAPQLGTPFRPDVCVGKNEAKNLVGWYRMGNDYGYMTAGDSGSAYMTNQQNMRNHALDLYADAGKFGLSGSGGRVETLSYAQFTGFSDVWQEIDSKVFKDDGSGGITRFGDAWLTGAVHMLTGAYKYPTYITGSPYNETMDGGIPRIGSASYSMGVLSGSNYGVYGPTSYMSYWSTGSSSPYGGIQRVERIPFEAVIDPRRLQSNTVTRVGANVNTALVDERVVFYETEPHPSASLQPCSFMRNIGGGNRTANAGIHNTNDINAMDPHSRGLFAYGEDTYAQTFVRGTPTTSSAMTSSFSLTEMRALGQTNYTKASNNFFAETMNFFLKGGHSTILKSADVLKQAVDPNKTYKMTLRLYRPPTEDFPIYNRPEAFGPPVDANSSGSWKEVGRDKTEYPGHGFSPFTPPHYDSYAEVEYTFTPEVGVKYESVEDVLETITTQNKLGTNTIKYNRFVKGTGSAGSTDYIFSGLTNSDFAIGKPGSRNSIQPIIESLNKSHAMQISSSFNGIDISEASLLPTKENTREDADILRKSWIIQSKWETPNMDFRRASAVQPKPYGLTKTLGMWHQTGSYKTPISFMEIRPTKRNSTSAPLDELLGMHFVSQGKELGNEVKRVSIGQMPEERKISEAVVAVPFIEGANGKRQFFVLPKSEVYKAVQAAGFSKYKKSEIEAVEMGSTTTSQNASGRSGHSEPIVPRKSIQDMVDKMLRYVIPPKMNFLKYNDPEENFISPFAMYIFEFEHTLSKNDIALMWQNLPPDVALNNFHKDSGDSLQAEAVVSHELTQNGGLLSDEKLNEGVKWLVFKAKKKAETNYFKKMKRDRLPNGHPDGEVSVENDIFDYGYNWPYDYFSLVELVKVEAEVGFARQEDISQPLTREEIASVVARTAGISINKEEEDSPRQFDTANHFSMIIKGVPKK